MLILVFAEQRRSRIRKAAREAISQARFLADQLGQKVAVLVVGSRILELVDKVKKYGPEEIYLADNIGLDIYQTETYTKILCDLVGQLKPGLVLMAHTSMAKDMAPRAAQRLRAGLVTDCVDIRLDSEGLSFVRPIYGGKALARLRITTQVQFVTLRPNIFPEVEASGETKVYALSLFLDTPKARTVELDLPKDSRPELTEAEIIVSGGRGLGNPDGFRLIEKLADLLGGAVGASRAAVDAKWRSQQYQVGQTGKIVTPKLYIACGISGAPQHLAGMRSSKCIVAINKDPEANIFNVADYGIVEDLYEVVPELITQLKKGQRK